MNRLLRKIHIYAGLALFLPLFIFAASGFMLNHRWDPWDNFDERTETIDSITVRIPESGTGLEKAAAILVALKMEGEINTLIQEPERDHMLIRSVRPGRFVEINLAPSTGRGTLKVTNLNSWSLLNNLHTFTGLHSNIPEKKNWFWTSVWSGVIDLTALIMVLLLGTGLYMWTGLQRERRTGLIILELGGAIIILIIWILSRF